MEERPLVGGDWRFGLMCRKKNGLASEEGTKKKIRFLCGGFNDAASRHLGHCDAVKFDDTVTSITSVH